MIHVARIANRRIPEYSCCLQNAQWYRMLASFAFAVIHGVNSFVPPKLPPLDLERRKLSQRITVFPHGSFLLFLCPWFRSTRHAFSTAISPCLYKRAFCIQVHDNVVSHANVVCTCICSTCTCTNFFLSACGDIPSMWRTFDGEECCVTRTFSANNFACFDAIVSGKEAYATSAKITFNTRSTTWPSISIECSIVFYRIWLFMFIPWKDRPCINIIHHQFLRILH